MKIKMIKNFLIISCIGKNDKLGLRINKDFFVHELGHYKFSGDKLLTEIMHFLKPHKVQLDKSFSIIVNQGPGSFSGIRISLAVAKGLEIAKNVKLFGFKSNDLRLFDQENVEKLIKEKLIEKKLIKPVYLS